MIGSAAVGVLADGTHVPMGVVMAIGGIGSLLIAAWIVRSDRNG